MGSGSEDQDISSEGGGGSLEEPDHKAAAPHKKKSVRFMEIDESELYHHRGSIHDELSQMDRMKPRSSTQVKQKNLSLADRAPPVFSLTSFTEPGNTSTLFPGVNPQKVANSEEEVDKEIDRFLEESTSG